MGVRHAAANLNEQLAGAAFSKQSLVFDELYAENTIVAYKRERVRSHVLKHIKPGSYILELNSGTGDDALFFAQKGFRIHATDISDGMQQQLSQKIVMAGLQTRVSTELCSYTRLGELKNKGPFDLIFSNFAGLNCTGELDKVLTSFDELLNPGGLVTLVLLPPFCLWETLLVFKGKFRTAFRRFSGASGAKAHVEGTHFRCWYYRPEYIIKRLKGKFDLISLEGLCIFVPPSYTAGFSEKHPSAYKFLKWCEDKLRSSWPWKYTGDYYIVSLRKK